MRRSGWVNTSVAARCRMCASWRNVDILNISTATLTPSTSGLEGIFLPPINTPILPCTSSVLRKGRTRANLPMECCFFPVTAFSLNYSPRAILNARPSSLQRLAYCHFFFIASSLLSSKHPTSFNQAHISIYINSISTHNLLSHTTTSHSAETRDLNPRLVSFRSRHYQTLKYPILEIFFKYKNPTV